MAAGRTSQGLDVTRTSALEAVIDALPDAAETGEQRRHALGAFAARGFPSRREEAWKYTDLKPIASAEFSYAPAPEPTPATRAAVAAVLEGAEAGTATTCAVFVDGRLDHELSQLTLPKGLSVTRLADAPTEFGSVFKQHAAFDSHPLAWLNTAASADGLIIRVANGTEIAEPLHIYFVGTTSGHAEQPRLGIELGANATLTVIVHSLDTAGVVAGTADTAATASWLNVVTSVTLGEGSRLNLHRLQEHGRKVFETSLLAAEIGKDATFEAGLVDVGGQLVRNDIDIRLVEPGANVELFGAFVAAGNQHIDDHIHIEHIAEHTRSRVFFRGMAAEDGHGIYHGMVVVRPGAQHTDSLQTSNNLLLAERAEINTSPMLEIYADDVKCNHGATVGEIDEDQLFYLQARGIDEIEARGLLTFAFAAQAIERLHPSLKARATAAIAGRLPGAANPGVPMELDS